MEPELIGGNWVQTNAYLLNDIKELIGKYSGNVINVNVEPTPVDITVNPTPVTVYPTPVQTEVILQQNIMLPQERIYVHIPLPILKPTPNTTFKVVTNYHRPAPLIIDVELQQAYARVCGSCVSMESYCLECHRCVDAWLELNKDGFYIKDLTSRGTGCSSKAPHQYTRVNPKPLENGRQRHEREEAEKAAATAKAMGEYMERPPELRGMRVFNRNSQEYIDYLAAVEAWNNRNNQ